MAKAEGLPVASQRQVTAELATALRALAALRDGIAIALAAAVAAEDVTALRSAVARADAVLPSCAEVVTAEQRSLAACADGAQAGACSGGAYRRFALYPLFSFP